MAAPAHPFAPAPPGVAAPPPPPPHLRKKLHPAVGGIPLSDGLAVHPEGEDYDLQSCETPRFDEPAPIQLEKRGISSHPHSSLRTTRPAVSQAEFWAAQTTHKNSIAAKLRQVGALDLAAGLELCHSEYTFAVCGDCGRVGKFPNRCDRFYCPECQPRLSHDRKEAVDWWTSLVTQPKHVVLTLRNIPDLTKAHVNEARKYVSALRRRVFATETTHHWQSNDPVASADPALDGCITSERIPAFRTPTATHHTATSHPWRGGFYSIEVTNEGRGWHLHFHLLVDSDYIDAKQLALEWRAATRGAGHIVKVKDARGTDYLRELVKYACKGSDLAKWSPDQILTFIHAFTGVKTFSVFGQLYAARTEFAEWIKQLREKKPRCECGSCNVKYYSEADYLALDLVPCSESRPRAPAPDTRTPDMFPALAPSQACLSAFAR